MAKAKRKNRPQAPDIIAPTPEQQANGAFARVLFGAVSPFRRIPIIDRLFDTGKLTEREYSNLAYYRDQAHRAEDDAATQGTLAPEKIMGGTGGTTSTGPLPRLLHPTPAILETARLERDLCQYRAIAHAVAVMDWSLAQWCIHKHGGRERYNGRGEFVAIVPNREREVMKYALCDLRAGALLIVR